MSISVGSAPWSKIELLSFQHVPIVFCPFKAPTIMNMAFYLFAKLICIWSRHCCTFIPHCVVLNEWINEWIVGSPLSVTSVSKIYANVQSRFSVLMCWDRQTVPMALKKLQWICVSSLLASVLKLHVRFKLRRSWL